MPIKLSFFSIESGPSDDIPNFVYVAGKAFLGVPFLRILEYETSDEWGTSDFNGAVFVTDSPIDTAATTLVECNYIRSSSFNEGWAIVAWSIEAAIPIGGIARLYLIWDPPGSTERSWDPDSGDHGLPIMSSGGQRFNPLWREDLDSLFTVTHFNNDAESRVDWYLIEWETDFTVRSVFTFEQSYSVFGGSAPTLVYLSCFMINDGIGNNAKVKFEYKVVGVPDVFRRVVMTVGFNGADDGLIGLPTFGDGFSQQVHPYFFSLPSVQIDVNLFSFLLTSPFPNQVILQRGTLVGIENYWNISSQPIADRMSPSASLLSNGDDRLVAVGRFTPRTFRVYRSSGFSSAPDVEIDTVLTIPGSTVNVRPSIGFFRP